MCNNIDSSKTGPRLIPLRTRTISILEYKGIFAQTNWNVLVNIHLWNCKPRLISVFQRETWKERFPFNRWLREREAGRGTIRRKIGKHISQCCTFIGSFGDNSIERINTRICTKETWHSVRDRTGFAEESREHSRVSLRVFLRRNEKDDAVASARRWQSSIGRPVNVTYELFKRRGHLLPFAIFNRPAVVVLVSRESFIFSYNASFSFLFFFCTV